MASQLLNSRVAALCTSHCSLTRDGDLVLRDDAALATFAREFQNHHGMRSQEFCGLLRIFYGAQRPDGTRLVARTLGNLASRCPTAKGGRCALRKTSYWLILAEQILPRPLVARHCSARHPGLSPLCNAPSFADGRLFGERQFTEASWDSIEARVKATLAAAELMPIVVMDSDSDNGGLAGPPSELVAAPVARPRPTPPPTALDRQVRQRVSAGFSGFLQACHGWPKFVHGPRAPSTRLLPRGQSSFGTAEAFGNVKARGGNLGIGAPPRRGRRAGVAWSFKATFALQHRAVAPKISPGDQF